MVMSSRIFASLLLGALWLAACAGAAPGDDPAAGLPAGYTFRPIQDIVDQELMVSGFAADGTATLSIETAVPVACSVVYGPTEAFGRLSLDQDMAGGTHSDHAPLLTGLEPETTYFFRVQGVDDQGVVYLSEVMTFTTPAFDGPAEPSANLAAPENGAVILGASSAFGGAGVDERWGPGSAFDDNPNTEWSSDGDGDGAWIEVQLARRARIERVALQSRSMADGSAIARAFTLVADGETLGPFALPAPDSSYSFDVAIEATTLRFNLIDTTGGNTGVVDIAVYGEFVQP